MPDPIQPYRDALRGFSSLPVSDPPLGIEMKVVVLSDLSQKRNLGLYVGHFTLVCEGFQGARCGGKSAQGSFVPITA